VAVVIDGLGYGGAETLLGDLAGGAAGAGLDLTVAYLHERDPAPAADRLRERGIEPVGVPVRGLLRPDGVRRMRAHLRAAAPDVVHTHLDYADVIGGAAARGLGVPVVSTVHLMRWDATDARTRVKLALFARARRAFADRVVAVSDAARAAYLARGWDRPERVVTVRNGITDAPRAGAGAAVRAGLGLGPDDLVVTMLSVLRPGKGHEAAFAAVAALRAQVPALRLLVAGDGPDRARLEAQAAGLGDAVAFAGHRTDAMGVLDATDVLLHPSLFDAFPTALLEAMAASVPVVASAVGGIPEIVQDGVTGTLVPVGSSGGVLAGALGPLLTDPARRRAQGAAARQRFQAEFTAPRWAGRLRTLYDGLR
jgi:glycosyltransferase involved in cell wall biosynthesis